jgi:excisionase family DNA binding protein
MLTPLLTPEHVAEYLGVKVKAVHRLVREGALACIQIAPRDRRFSEEQVQDYLRSRTVAVPSKRIDSNRAGSLSSRRGFTGKKLTGDLSARGELRREVRSWR